MNHNEWQYTVLSFHYILFLGKAEYSDIYDMNMLICVYICIVINDLTNRELHTWVL